MSEPANESKYGTEERYIMDENAELSMGSSPLARKVISVFPAVANKNYRLFFSSQLVSLIGTWLQMVAEGWLVVKLTNSAFMVGLVLALSMAPTLLFSLFGGVIVDRFPKKNILLLTQTLSMILALIYGVLTVAGLIQIWQICVLAFLLGTVTALDLPARQAFMSEMVKKEELASAIALNSGIFNGARVIGPAFAGVLIALVGTGGAFILNGISYIASIVGLLLMKVPEMVSRKHLHPIAAIKEGIVYSFSHPVIKTLLLFAAVTSVFGWSYSTVMPIMAKNVFHQDASGLGYLYVATGLGALVSTFVVSIYTKKIPSIIIMVAGNAVFAVSIILLSFTTNYHLALVLLFFSGLGLITQFSTMNTTIQHLVADEVRGRVMSIWTIMFLGLAPFGSLQVGFLSEKFGTGLAIRVGAILVFIFGIYMFNNRHKVRAEYKEYKKEAL